MNGTTPSNAFVFAIIAQYSADGHLVDYALQSENEGVRKEMIFTLMRNWLRMEEDRYHADFVGKQS